MARSGALARTLCGSLGPLTCVLLTVACLSAASPPHGRRLICWQAILNCQTEPECNYAYDHYMRACGPVLSGVRKKCPSHCISSLVQLNLTRNGPALEDCSCGHDPVCSRTKRAIEPCLPRTTSTGCTEARRQCERDQQCSSTMRDYLHHCGKLFSGAVCTNACRNVIANMRKIPKGQQLDTCVCDGTERAICEFVKSSMKSLCFDAPERAESSGWHDGDDPEDDEDYPDSVYREEPESGASLPQGRRVLILLLASFLALLPLY
ncbi:growth arrest-specific protein 1a [Syngnathoides biaculeatus]|uniref:growth arrest-specific protein 1a n=1 Tax=Syngnathoides biaculeatus TaxID=300417 RepID=UPI002ADDB0FF|nr:growth arrest-specific protein 1a [Syngnathoides biaculeatus]XP_061671932.1 growth arrest-specific protein 1a [Syngnathoides biaculeatus]